jgi:2-oxoglutarate dehydrogenase E1 component
LNALAPRGTAPRLSTIAAGWFNIPHPNFALPGDLMALDDLLSGHNLAFAEAMYADFLTDPASVPEDWRALFAGLEVSGLHPADLHGPSFPKRSIFAGAPATTSTNGRSASEVAASQDRLDQLVRAYRVRGHMVADLDPLGQPRASSPELDFHEYGFTEADLGRKFSARTLYASEEVLTLQTILDRLRTTYCGSIGVQFMHIDDREIKNWLQQRMESTLNRLELTRDEQVRVLTKLTDAEIFEQFIHKKFLGAKRFSLEGGESLIPLIDQALELAGEQGAKEAVIAMAHRGRLNVLANILGKHPAQIFREFADRDPELHFGRGDVKYHMGHSADHVTAHGKRIHLSLCFNPSHLEFVDPVLLGRVRAKQDRRNDTERRQVLPIMIHGDAAFAGQGIVMEVLNLSELPGYRVGGTVHVIVNNQIGFTTPPESARSCDYSSDVAKMLQIPIFHVNGEDPEAVAQVIRLAMDFRARFQKDVVIDMWCYRKYGHNEGDDPAFTQPVMYGIIRKRQTVREAYLDNLLKLNGISREEGEEIALRRRQVLDDALSQATQHGYALERPSGQGIWAGRQGGPDLAVPDVETGVPVERLAALMQAQAQVPEGFEPHPKIKNLLELRREMAAGQRALDWGAAEGLAFASLLAEGTNIRLSGQDSGRGTFSHRHGVLHDYQTGRRHVPLNHLGGPQGQLDAIDSPLSEAAVLGFDYGYSLDSPDQLVIWEAQFGDFVNGAQVIIDQFIVSSEDKWNRLSGLVMLLPHGFEGQGPEHSSARLERFLSLCAEDCIQVCNLSTPAQIFHCLRRQVVRPWRKPLIVMSPKSLLRNPECVSTLADLSQGGFQRVIPDGRAPAETRRVLLCSGKIYYDLVATRQILGADHVAIHRIEQLYPLQRRDIDGLLGGLAAGTPVVWVQEEPRNQGAWPHLRQRFGERIHGYPFSGISREASASPATGSLASHKMEQDLIMEQAFELA